MTYLRYEISFHAAKLRKIFIGCTFSFAQIKGKRVQTFALVSYFYLIFYFLLQILPVSSP